MTPEQLEAIRKRAEKATPGPWRRAIGAGQQMRCIEALKQKVVVEYPFAVAQIDAVNMEFIAHVREDIPALLAEVKRLEEYAKRLLNEGVTALLARDASMKLAQQLAEALHLTQEYVGDATLPKLPGWSWYDALQAYEAAMGVTP